VKVLGSWGPFCKNDSKVTLTVSPAGVALSSTSAGFGTSGANFTFDPKAAGIGTHTIMYTYSNGACTINSSQDILVVDNPKVVTGLINLSACSGVTGDLTLPAITAGSTPGIFYTYWTDAAATIPVATPKAVAAGIYYIKGATASGKCFDIQSILVQTPPELLQAIIPTPAKLKCAGDSTGTMTVNVTKGTPSYTYTWDTNPPQITTSATSSNTAINLRVGPHTVLIVDGNGCTNSFTADIEEPDPIRVKFYTKNIECMSDANGVARVDSINGSADFKLLNSFTYLWNSVPPQTSREAVRLTYGFQKLTMTDSKGCILKDSAYIDVLDVTPPVINCPKDIEMTVQYIKSTDPNKYTVDVGKPFGTDNCAVDTITNDAPSKFRVGLTKVVWTVVDQVGLMDTCTQRIYVKEIPTVPQLISPNGDGVNDKFIIEGLTSLDYRNSQLTIFTRSGQLIFQSSNYELPENAWDGRYAESSFSKNQLVAPGVYYYILKLGSSSQTMKGYVYVYY
jgi:gliding motility-associated-like protein